MAGADWTPEQYSRAKEYIFRGVDDEKLRADISAAMSAYEDAHMDDRGSDRGPVRPLGPSAGEPVVLEQDRRPRQEKEEPSQLGALAKSQGEEFSLFRDVPEKPPYTRRDKQPWAPVPGVWPGPELMRPGVQPIEGRVITEQEAVPIKDPNVDKELPTLSKRRDLFAPPMNLGDGGMPRVAYEPPLERVQQVFAQSQALQARFGGIPTGEDTAGYKAYADALWRDAYADAKEKGQSLVRYSQIDFLFKERPALATIFKYGSNLLTGGASVILGLDRGLTGGVITEATGAALENASGQGGLLQDTRQLRDEGLGGIPSAVGTAVGAMNPGSLMSRVGGAMAGPGMMGAMRGGAAMGAADAAVSGGAQMAGDAATGRDVSGQPGQILEQAGQTAALGGALSGPLHLLGSGIGAGVRARRSSLNPQGRERALAHEGGVGMNLLERRGVRLPERVKEIGRQIDRAKTKESITDVASERAGKSTLVQAAKKIDDEIADLKNQKSAYYAANPNQQVAMTDAVDFVDKALERFVPEGGALPVVKTGALKDFYSKAFESVDIVPETLVQDAVQRGGQQARVFSPELAVERGIITADKLRAAESSLSRTTRVPMKVVAKVKKVTAEQLDSVLDAVDDAAGEATTSGAKTQGAQFFRALGSQLRKARDEFSPVSNVAPKDLTRRVRVGNEDIEVSGWSALNETMRERLRDLTASKKRLGLGSGTQRIDVNDPAVLDSVVKRVKTYMDEGSPVHKELVVLANANPQLRQELKDLLAAKFGQQLRGEGLRSHVTNSSAGSISPRVFVSSRLDEITNRLEAIGTPLAGRVRGKSVKYRDLSKPMRNIVNGLKAYTDPEFLSFYLADSGRKSLKYIKDRRASEMLADGLGVVKRGARSFVEPLTPRTFRNALETSLNYGLPLRGGSGGRIEAIRQEFSKDRDLTDLDYDILEKLDKYYKAIEEESK